MKTETLGPGEPEVAVVGLVHGVEVCGLRAINRLKRKVEGGEIKLENSVKLVLANEMAFERGEKLIDADLNRSFPGDKSSDKHEERLAAELMEELEGLKILDIHASQSQGTPFSIISGLNEGNLEAAKETCMENIIEISFVEGNFIDQFDAATVLEAGPYNSEESARTAYNVAINFLAANGVIDRDYDLSDPDIFEVYGKAEGSGFEFIAENFERVNEGEVFARKPGEEKKASERFYPVLMSTDGYDDMIGFRAKKLNEKDLPQS